MSIFFILILFIIILIFLIIYYIDHKRIKSKHNCNIHCVLNAPMHLFYKYNSLISTNHVIDNYNLLPEIKIIEDNFKLIYTDFLKIKHKLTPIYKDHYFNDIIKDDKWSKYYIKWYNKIPNHVLNDIPNLSKLINSLPNIKLAMFSVMKPGTVVLPHRGPFRGCVRCHLGIDIPNNNCYIKISDIKYYWKKGKCLVFDDTYEHEVINDSNHDRIVLFLDIQRPLKNYNLIKFINNVLLYINSFSKVI